MHLHAAKRALLRSGLFGANTIAGRLLGSERDGAVFDFANDYALVRDNARTLNFKGTVQQAFDASVGTFTRATDAGRTNAAGFNETVASGIWRRQYDPLTLAPLGYLPEPLRTNSIRNNTGVGASAPTTLPTNWSAADTGGGITINVVGTGVERGITYVDIRLSGTTSNATSTQLSLETTTGIAATQNQSWALSAHISLVAGSLTGLGAITLDASVRGADGSSQLEFLSGSDFSGQITSALTRFSQVLATTNASTGRIVPRLRIAQSSGVAVDATFRIGLPQAEGTAAYATSPIPTAGSAVTRNADVMTVALSNLPSVATAFTLIVTAQKSPDAASHRSASINDGGATNRATLLNTNAGTSGIRGIVLSSGVNVADITATGVISGRYKTAQSVAANDVQLVHNGVSIGTDTSAAMPSGLLVLDIGAEDDLNHHSAPIESVVVIPRRLSESELIARTA